MAQDLNFHVKNTLLRIEWKTELPDKSDRRSSRFSLMGSEWCLIFFSNSGGYNGPFYTVKLNPEKPGGKEEDLKTQFEVETYLIDTTVQFVEPFGWKWRKITHRNSGESIFNSNLRKSGKHWLLGREVKIVCTFFGVDPFQEGHKTEPETLKEHHKNLECLSSDLTGLLEGAQLPDLRLKCGEHTFDAHRLVLAARSKKFADMFGKKTSEIKTSEVNVSEFKPDVVRQFLQYVYSGKLSAESRDAVVDLFAIADKYDVHSLKSVYMRRILDELTEGNCFEYLTNLHGSQALKKVVVDFICGHPAVMQSKEWKKFSDKNLKLAFEVQQIYLSLQTEAKRGRKRERSPSQTGANKTP